MTHRFVVALAALSLSSCNFSTVNNGSSSGAQSDSPLTAIAAGLQEIDAALDEIIATGAPSSCAGRAVDGTCVAGATSSERVANYTNCAAGNGYTFSGQVKLRFDQSSCRFSQSGDQVSRTADLLMRYSSGTSPILEYRKSYLPRGDYTGATYGGGSLFRQAGATSWTFSVSGTHRRMNEINSADLLEDFSIRTLSSVAVTGGLTRALRKVSGGEIAVADSIQKKTYRLVPTNLSYSNSCCYPVSGKVTVTVDGESSSSELSFGSQCGQLQLTGSTGTATALFLDCHG